VKLPKVAIVNYGLGNLRSAKRGFEKSGAEVLITDDPKQLSKSDAIVLPGVGAFAPAAKNLIPLSDVVKQSVADGRPLLGICLGLQLLFTRSSEGESIEGLNLIAGDVVKLPESVKIPQMGWNTIEIVKPNLLFEGVPNFAYVYFVHSYVPKPLDKSVILTRTEYGVKFPSAIAKNNIFATQFHPEKSSKTGAMILKNFVKIVKR
jgi:glutamine amidotransferase